MAWKLSQWCWVVSLEKKNQFKYDFERSWWWSLKLNLHSLTHQITCTDTKGLIRLMCKWDWKPAEHNAVREYLLFTEARVDCNILPSVCVCL